jgi:methionyl aminopeptidase
MGAITRKSPAEIALMRRAGAIVAEIHDLTQEAAVPGASTAELNAIAERCIKRHGATSNFKGYHGFPAFICISLDSEVVHGIPGDREIKEGALVSIDAGAIWEGWHADGARSFVVGEGTPEAQRLVAVTREALDAGIAAARPGATIEEISGAVEDVALRAGYGIVRPYVGHGIGRAMHEAPQVPNYRTGIRSQFDPEGRTWERDDATEVHHRAILDDHGRIMVLALHNTDNGDGWEREGESDYYFKNFSEKIAYPLGINVMFYVMTH